ncbi:hypothetical protein SCHPADRAFT_908523 [Schizopora paradoxa]|uniref:Uncharacterized protein n=1 Tax=Schizopora paradoxa TaxID=27342 RepID=A0A0H2RUT8_9AGAM|nr:hypothetical protein SCHPADRAFT_908523 [Schizopora paradoxa]
MSVMTPSLPLVCILLCLSSVSLARPSSWTERFAAEWTRRDSSSSSRNVPPEGFYQPTSFLTNVPGTFPAGLGEPLNVIISGNSDAAVLVNQLNDGGLQNYFQSVGFSGTCLGQIDGLQESVDLGDGNGTVNQTDVMRWNYGDPTLGTCKETVEGGNHFRYWIQDGPTGNSGAIFLAESYELPVAQDHDIIDNGYNLGRDWLVGNATSNTFINTTSLTANATFSGQTSAQGFTYQTSVIYLSGLLPNTSDGINHFITVGDGQNAVDGLVAVLTVKISQRPQNTASSFALPLFTTPSAALTTTSLLMLGLLFSL